ncbi:hypothetical protein PybrP1_010210 [[Pythium] brassicae (nom. inval.)]|nr:hypothetical protein PybrP1_010210 [[Pythium] brassicae (nom. inval.)]
MERPRHIGRVPIKASGRAALPRLAFRSSRRLIISMLARHGRPHVDEQTSHTSIQH